MSGDSSRTDRYPITPPLPEAVLFALTGEIEGCRRTYILTGEITRIGRLPVCDVVLAPDEVSRRHAELRVGNEGLSIEDLGSRNGTFVNGVRVGRSPVAVGDRIAFGPVTLEVEDLGTLDGELATAPSPPREASPGEPPSETTMFHQPLSPRGSPDSTWLQLLGEFLDRISGERLVDLVPALAHLGSTLGTQGAALVEFPAEGRPILMAGFGDFDQEPLGALPLPGVPPQGGRLRWVETMTSQGVALTVLVLWPAHSEPVGLALWGEVPPRAEIEPFLLTLLLLVGRLRQGRCRYAGAGFSAAKGRLVFPPGHLRCTSAAMTGLYAQMAAVTASNLPLLIVGETGVGKEGIARALHLSSDRREGAFVAVNCAAIPAELLEAELFGIEKGAATGIRARPGKFRLAAAGMLFLDEIGDMSPEFQAKLLRALQEREVEPVGSGGPVSTDVRVVAATNMDLEKRMAAGRFRHDLYYRLAGSVLRVAPLRERREDIPALVGHFLRSACHKAGKRIQGFTVGAVRRLSERPWPGNVRELEHEVQRLVCLCQDGAAIVTATVGGSPVPAEQLAPAAAEEPTAQVDRYSAGPRDTGDSFSASSKLPSLDLASLECLAIEEALERCAGNQTRAAKLLGIGRTALHRRLARYRLPTV